MALSFGVSASAGNGFTESLTTSGVTTQGAGSTFVVLVAGPSVSQIVNVSDNMGNSYPSVPQTTITYNASGDSGTVWVCQNGAGGSGHTFNVAINTFTAVSINVVEITSGGAYATVDQSLTLNNRANVTSLTSPSVTPSANNAAVIAFVVGANSSNTTITDASGFNNILSSYTSGATANQLGAMSGQIQTTATAANDVFAIGSTTQAGGATISFVPASVYNGISQLDYSVVTASSTITTSNNLALSPGNLAIAIGYSHGIVNATFSDSLGNQWSPYNSSFAALNNTTGLAGFISVIQFGGNATFTLAGTAASNAIYVGLFNINGGAGTLVGANGHYVASIVSGGNNATTGNIACGSAYNLGFALCFDKAATATPAQGTGGPPWNGTTGVWQTYGGGSVAPAKPENSFVTGTIPFTFSTNNPGDTVFTIGCAISLQQLPLVPLMGQILM